MSPVTTNFSSHNIDHLNTLSNSEIIELFTTLQAPDMSEMNGEFNAAIVGKSSVARGMVDFAMYNPMLFGNWKGKGFSTESETSETGTAEPNKQGHGYNLFKKGGNINRQFRMRTRIRPSRYDGKDSFQLNYAFYKSIYGMIQMIDEVRKLEDGLYLGIGTWGATPKLRAPLISPFTLSGPAEPFVGADKEELKK